MKNNFKISCLKTCLLFLTLASMNSPFVNATEPVCSTCPSPTSWVTGQTANSVSIAWYAEAGATGYELWYCRQEDSFTSPVMSTINTSYTIPNLSPGTYVIFVRTICDGEPSAAAPTSGGEVVVDPSKKGNGV